MTEEVLIEKIYKRVDSLVTSLISHIQTVINIFDPFFRIHNSLEVGYFESKLKRLKGSIFAVNYVKTIRQIQYHA